MGRARTSVVSRASARDTKRWASEEWARLRHRRRSRYSWYQGIKLGLNGSRSAARKGSHSRLPVHQPEDRGSTEGGGRVKIGALVPDQREIERRSVDGTSRRRAQRVGGFASFADWEAFIGGARMHSRDERRPSIGHRCRPNAQPMSASRSGGKGAAASPERGMGRRPK